MADGPSRSRRLLDEAQATIYDEQRRVHLCTIQECARRAGVSEKTVRRALKAPHVYTEEVDVKNGRGTTRTLYVDLATTGLKLPADTDGHVQAYPNGWTEQVDSSAGTDGHTRNDVLALLNADLTPPAPSGNGWTQDMSLRTDDAPAPALRHLSNADVSVAAIELHQRLQPALRLKRGTRERGEAVTRLAESLKTTPRQVQRWLKALEANANSPYALTRRSRADKGKLRLPADKRDLITAAFLSNKPGVSASAVYRALVRAVPDELTYVTVTGAVKKVELHTVRAVQKELQDDPVMQLIFKDTTERKEFMRVYNGKVRAFHANYQWQIDMTRCDTEVFDPVTRKFYRLRVQYVIDVYSGCIMGLSFSRDEDTTQMKIALLRALQPKPGRYAHLYPMYGTPTMIYWDNGKTYTCHESVRILKQLGIDDVHSKPRVSHTRGKVERAFGTAHQMLERALPGYVGENAVSRDSEELRQLRERTLRWQDTGRDPGRANRHLTEEEFKSVFLVWLLTEYHQMKLPNGLTREETYRASVEAEARHTLRLYDQEQLFTVFCKHIEKTVTKDGGILHLNKMWKSPSGALAGYAGKRVLLLEDSFSPEGYYGVAYQRLDGTYVALGDVTPASEWADTAESEQTRQIEKGARRALMDKFKEEQATRLRPELSVAQSLINALPPADPNDLPVIDVTPTPEPSHRAHLALADRQDEPDDFATFLKPGGDATSADEFLQAVKTRIPRKKP